MRRAAFWCGALLLASLPAQAGQKLVASDTGASIKHEGRIVISNQGSTITAWQFDGDIRRALVRVRSSKLQTHFYGPVLYESDAQVRGGVPPEIAKTIRAASRKHGVDPRLVAAIAWRESGFDPTIVSRRGATGIMQLMPQTAEFLGVSDIFNVHQNIFAGTRYLRMLLDSFHGDLELALAAYNAGPGAVERYRGIPPYKETISYVKNVRHDYEKSLRSQS